MQPANALLASALSILATGTVAPEEQATVAVGIIFIVILILVIVAIIRRD
jgi:hypothetical protein